jgi:hypothetical protein
LFPSFKISGIVYGINTLTGTKECHEDSHNE